MTLTRQLVGVRWAAVYNGLDHNVMPRDDLQKAETSKKLKPAHLAMLKRRAAAHYNGLENLAFFVAAVVAVNQAKMPVAAINQFVVRYVVSRFIYTVICASVLASTGSSRRHLQLQRGLCLRAYDRLGALRDFRCFLTI